MVDVYKFVDKDLHSKFEGVEAVYIGKDLIWKNGKKDRMEYTMYFPKFGFNRIYSITAKKKPTKFAEVLDKNGLGSKFVIDCQFNPSNEGKWYNTSPTEKYKVVDLYVSRVFSIKEVD